MLGPVGDHDRDRDRAGLRSVGGDEDGRSEQVEEVGCSPGSRDADFGPVVARDDSGSVDQAERRHG